MLVDIRRSSTKSDQSEATTSHEYARLRREGSPLRSEEVSSTTTTPERPQDTEHGLAASTPLSPSTSWESSSFSSSDWLDSSADASALAQLQQAERRRQAARNLSAEFDAVRSAKSARLESGEGPVMCIEVSSTITTGTTPPPVTQSSESREGLLAASTPSFRVPSPLSAFHSPLDSSVSPVRGPVEQPGYVALQQSSRNLDVTTDSENCPLLRSSEMLQEISIGDEPATNQGERSVSDAGNNESCPGDEASDPRSATGVGSSEPQLVAGEQIARAAEHPLDSFPINFPPTNHPINPTVLGLSTRNTQSGVPTEPSAYQRLDAQHTAGGTWAHPIAGTTHASAESPVHHHFGSSQFTSHPLNQSLNPVVGGLPISCRQVTDPWAPYSDQLSGPQRNISSVATATAGLTSETARTEPIFQTTYQESNFLHQSNPDPLPINRTVVVAASTSNTQTRAPASSVEMSMLSNLSDFRAFPGVQTGVSKSTATKVFSTGINRDDEARWTLQRSSGGVASVDNSQSNLPLMWQMPELSPVTEFFAGVMAEQYRELPVDLSRASTSRHPPGFPPVPQRSSIYDSVYIPFAALQYIAPRPPPGFPKTPQLTPQNVSALGIPLHAPRPVCPPPGFAATRHRNASNIQTQPPRIESHAVNQITLHGGVLPPASSGCTTEHDVKQTTRPSSESPAPRSVSPSPRSVSPAPDPAVTCRGSDKGDKRTDTE